jgi:NADP-reducing hydrogenase subunit HndB
MEKLSVETLQSLYRNLKSREHTKVVIVHMGTCGIASGSEGVLQAVLAASEELGGTGVTIKTSGCAGLCSREPMMTVELPGAPPVKYCDLDPVKATRIYSEHVLGGRPVSEYVLGAGAESLH